MGKIEIKLVIRDDKGLRIDAIGIPVGDTPSSVASILRRKFLRIIGKHVPVLGAGELPMAFSSDRKIPICLAPSFIE